MLLKFLRTIKSRLWRIFTDAGNHNWESVISRVVQNYNQTKHSAHGRKPDDITPENENEIRKILYPAKFKKKRNKNHAKFRVGDMVRISLERDPFQKFYEQTMTLRVFEVVKVQNTDPITYSLKNYKNEILEGSFYANELELVDKSSDTWSINQIHDSRIRNGITEYLVSWLDFPLEEKQWIPATDLYDIKDVN